MPAPFPSSLAVSADDYTAPRKDLLKDAERPWSQAEAGNGTASALSLDLSLAVLILGVHLGLSPPNARWVLQVGECLQCPQ